MPIDNLNLVFDCSLLGMGYLNPKARTGIFRAVQQSLLALLNQPGFQFQLVGFNQETSPWYRLATKLYFQEKQFNLKSATLALDSAWDSYFKYPIAIQKATLENFSSFELLRKAVVAMQIPFDGAINLLPQPRPNLDNWDVYHSPYFPLPEVVKAACIPRVITIYDLTPILYPHLCSGRTLQQFHHILNSIDRDRDWVICISEATKQDFCDYTSMDISRVFVTPLAASDRFQPIISPDEIAQVLRCYHLEDTAYLLSLATLEPRKNLAFLVRCFLKLLRENPSLDLKLVLVGISGWKNSSIFEAVNAYPDLGDRIVFTGFLPDQDLNAIYSGALAFVYPSIHEGFGLPPLEAMQCGIPVITSNVSALPEVVGDAGLMVDPTDEDAMSQALLSIVTDSGLRKSLAQKGLARAAHFSWIRCAEETAKVYQTAVEHRDRL